MTNTQPWSTLTSTYVPVMSTAVGLHGNTTKLVLKSYLLAFSWPSSKGSRAEFPLKKRLENFIWNSNVFEREIISALFLSRSSQTQWLLLCEAGLTSISVPTIRSPWTCLYWLIVFLATVCMYQRVTCYVCCVYQRTMGVTHTHTHTHTHHVR